MSPLTRFVLAWLFWGGFTFLIATGVWTIVTIRRMRQAQEVKLAILRENTSAVTALLQLLEQSRP